MQLDNNRLEIPAKALYLSPAEGVAKAHCYTNFEPHFNPAMKLSAIIMKNFTGKVCMHV